MSRVPRTCCGRGPGRRAGGPPASGQDRPPRRAQAARDLRGRRRPRRDPRRLVQPPRRPGRRPRLRRPASKCFRFENARPGRPSRASRAFGVDGREVEAVVVGAWVRSEDVVPGERLGDDPGLVIDFLGDPLQLKAVRRGVARPLEDDRPRVDPRRQAAADPPRHPPGDPLDGPDRRHRRPRSRRPDDRPGPDRRQADDEPRRSTATSSSATPTRAAGPSTGARIGSARASIPRRRRAERGRGPGLCRPGLPVGRFRTLEVVGRGPGQRPPGGQRGDRAGLLPRRRRATAARDERRRPGPDLRRDVRLAPEPGTVDVPPGAVRALIHFEKASGFGTSDGRRRPGRHRRRRGPLDPLPRRDRDRRLAPGRPLAHDRRRLGARRLGAPRCPGGQARVRRSSATAGSPSRTGAGAVLRRLAAPAHRLPRRPRADELADRLARSGVNLVRLAELDTPLGPARSLFDDTRDDTEALDPDALARLDHLIAAVKRRGIYVAIELQGARRFRDGDDSIAEGRKLPAGGGPAAAFDPSVREAARKAADQLLGHVNPETGLALRDDPALAWFTLAGELSLFDLVDAADTRVQGRRSTPSGT